MPKVLSYLNGGQYFYVKKYVANSVSFETNLVLCPSNLIICPNLQLWPDLPLLLPASTLHLKHVPCYFVSLLCKQTNANYFPDLNHTESTFFNCQRIHTS